ncbi:MAG: SBBP repeat-containing protein [Nitrospirae bacterium]|nr:SBBP repeat-containing protein [Nitrospirota bacterium]
MGTEATDYADGVSVDSSGNIYAAGRTDGSLDGKASSGNADLFIVKYNGNGVKQWTLQLGTSDFDVACDVVVDSSGSVYAAGYTDGSLDGNTNAGDLDIFVVKYNGDGVKQWTRQMGTQGVDIAYSVSADSLGNVYAAGQADAALDGCIGVGGLDLFVVKFNSDGMKQWTRQMGAQADDYAHGISVDSFGNVFAAGYTGGNLGGNTSAGSNDLFLAKFTPNLLSTITYPTDGASISGTDATISGWSLASNGVAYVMVSTDGGASWQTASGTDPWSFLWSLPTNTTSNIISRASDTLSNDESLKPGIMVIVNRPLTIDSLTADPASPRAYGTEITWTASASGGTGDYLYCYYRKGPDTGNLYVKERDWDVSDSWAWTPAAAQVGTNYIKVKVKNSVGGLPVESYTSFKVTPAPLAIQSFGPSPASPKPSGTLITWTTTATGGSGSYLYKYWRKGPDTGGLYAVARDWNASGAWDWTPDAGQAGYNYIKVQVKSSTGGTVLYTSQTFKVQ